MGLFEVIKDGINVVPIDDAEGACEGGEDHCYHLSPGSGGLLLMPLQQLTMCLTA